MDIIEEKTEIKTEIKTDNTEMSSNTEAEVNVPVAQVENKTSEEETTSNNLQLNSGLKLKKVFYKFTPKTYEEFESDVNEWTNNLSHETNSTNTVEYFKNTLSKAKDETDSGVQLFSAWTYAPKNPDITKQLIGKDGCYLHKTTENYGLYAIWHNRTENKFYVVGPKYRKPEEIEAPTRVPDGKDVNVLKGSLDFLRYRMMKLRQKK
tara:strand:+ start:178 stop:798 length:621 start_codon:yes stop_codon:yes gene_type:complete